MIHYYSPERLRSLRNRAMLSQRDVERLTGISDATIAYLECGRHRPQSGTLRKLLLLYAMNINLVERQEAIWGRPDETVNAPRPIRTQEVPPESWCSSYWRPPKHRLP